MERITERVNLMWAAAATLLAAVFGTYWQLFAAFAALNIVDYISGIIKARCAHTENSAKGMQGIIRKLGCWVVIAIAFFTAEGFIDVGKAIGIDLGFTAFIGWFTLCTFIINEMRSVLENLVCIGVDVPVWLIKGLEVADRRISRAAGGDGDADD